jgi:hypothetical protein
MSIASLTPSYSKLSASTRKIEPLQSVKKSLEASLDVSLTKCKQYLSEYLALVRIIDITDDKGLTSKEFKILDEDQYNNLIMSLLHLWFEYNKVFRILVYDTTADRFNKFGNDLTELNSMNKEYNDMLVLFKKLAIYDNSLPTNKSKADLGIMNLITRALIHSKDNDNRTLFRTQDYQSPIIAEIICHFLRVYFDTYFRRVRFESEKKRLDLLIRLDEIITLNDTHSCIHIHTGVGKTLDGDRKRFCEQIKIICETMDNFGIMYTRSKSVVKLCNTATEHTDVALEMEDLLHPTTDGGRSSRRRKAYKTTRRNNKHKNKNQYRRKRRTKRCKKSNRRRRSCR